MLCEKCKIREANIKYTEIINGVKTEHNLCSHCAREMDFGQYGAVLDGEFPLGRLLSGLLGLEEDEEDTDERAAVVCPTCGTSFDDFVENSRFGCPDCYGVFDLFINDKIKQLQGSENHKGKHPKFRSKFEKEHPDALKAPEEPIKGQTTSEDNRIDTDPGKEKMAVSAEESLQVVRLQKALKEAVSKEDYESAARYRDEIRALKAKAAEGRDEKGGRTDEPMV